MYFSIGKGVTTFLVILFFSTLTKAQELNIKAISFIAQPANCVTLHQGRTCFAHVTLHWKSSGSNDICVYKKLPKKLIQCWQQSKENSAVIEFESSTKAEYQLVNKQSNTVIAETIVNVSWVHKASPRKRRWRLF